MTTGWASVRARGAARAQGRRPAAGASTPGARCRRSRCREQDRVHRPQLRATTRARAAARLPTRPMLFAKFANTIIGDGEAIVRPTGTRALDLEVELGVVIGRRGAARDARGRRMDARRRATSWSTTSAPATGRATRRPSREGEKGDGQWLRAKGSDTFLPVGPVLVTPDELDPRAGPRGCAAGASRRAATREPILMQDGNTARPALRRAARSSASSRQADHARARRPHRHRHARRASACSATRRCSCEPGDRVRCEIEGIGSVENPIVDWTEDPRPGS